MSAADALDQCKGGGSPDPRAEGKGMIEPLIVCWKPPERHIQLDDGDGLEMELDVVEDEDADSDTDPERDSPELSDDFATLEYDSHAFG